MDQNDGKRDASTRPPVREVLAAAYALAGADSEDDRAFAAAEERFLDVGRRFFVRSCPHHTTD